MPTKLLHRVPLLASLPANVLNHLEENLEQLDLPEGKVLFREGELGDSFYFLLDGQLDIVKELGYEDQRVMDVRGAGDFVGEMALLVRDGRRTASVVAHTPVRLLKISHEDFDLLLQRWPGLAVEMLREISVRFKDSQNATIRDLQEKNRQLAQAYQELKAAQAQIIEKELIDRELRMARRIQESILPRQMPKIPGFDLGARMEPARAVGGDFFDFIPLDKDTCSIIIGDVSDKGVPAAIFMALTRSLLRAKATRRSQPRQVLEKVNRLVMDMNEANMFATVLYGILNRETSEFTYARAGHEVPLLFSPVGEIISLTFSQGQPLGLFEEAVFDQNTVHIPAGGLLLMYTDGVVDAHDSEGSLFGLNRFIQAIAAHAHKPAQAICNDVLYAINNHRGEIAQTDDITLVAVRAVDSPEKGE